MSILDSFENTFNSDNVFFLKRRMFEQMLRFTVTEEYNRRKTAHTSNHTFIATYALSPHVIYDDLVRRYFYPEYGFKFGSFTWSTKPCWKEHASNAKVSRIKALFSLDDNDIALLIDNDICGMMNDYLYFKPTSNFFDEMREYVYSNFPQNLF